MALSAAGCGDSASVVVPPPPTTTAPARAAGSGPAIPPAYTGLGSAGAAFARGHLESARGRQPGVPLVSGVVVNAAGRVTAYAVEFNDRPALTDRERLVSAAGIADLPRDRITVAATASCLVYGSPGLKRLIGLSYARVSTVAATTTASVQSRPTSAC